MDIKVPSVPAGLLRSTSAGLATVAAGASVGGLSAFETSTLGILAAGASLLVTLATPAIGLSILALAVPASQIPEHPVLGTGPLIGLLAAVVLGYAFRGELATRSMHGSILSMLIASIVLISAVIASNKSSFVQIATPALVIAVPILCIPLICDANTASRHALLSFAFGCATVAAFHVIAGDRTTFTAASQTVADPVNHNTFASMLVIAIAILLARLGSAANRAFQVTAAIAIVSLISAVGFSYSRSSYAGMLIVLLLFLVRRSIRATIFVGVLSISALPLLPDSITERVGSTSTASGGLEVSSAVRIDLWFSALKMAVDHPVFGVGYLGFADRLPEYFVSTGDYSTSGIRLPLLLHSHNLFLTILAETGLVGSILIAILFMKVLRKAWGLLKESKSWTSEAALLTFAGTAICCIFGEPLLTLPVLIPFTLSLAIGCRRPT